MILDNIAPDIDEAIKDGTIKVPPGRCGARVNTPGIGDDFFLSAGKFNPVERPRRTYPDWYPVRPVRCAQSSPKTNLSGFPARHGPWLIALVVPFSRSRIGASRVDCMRARSLDLEPSFRSTA
jgi:hypothetical protein